jgi:hypothetical protein
METKSQKMILIIENIVELLKMSSPPDAKYFCAFLVYILGQLNKPHELDKIAENILNIYGGMGTFGDVAIFNNGVYLDEEHDKFDALRTKLFLLCKEVIEEAGDAE